jgi:Arc/MetJ-type ribon-helix-helix transcriptional regulator
MKTTAATRPERAESRDYKSERDFTRAEWARIRAHIRARGMTFKVFLPESMAKWLRKKIAAGHFKDPAEAAFIAFQDLQELERHPQVRKRLVQAMLQDAMDDPHPGIPFEKVRADHYARLRRYVRTKPPHPKPLPKRSVSPSRNP